MHIHPKLPTDLLLADRPSHEADLVKEKLNADTRSSILNHPGIIVARERIAEFKNWLDR